MMLGRTTTAVLGAAGLAFVGYCIYFDRKRRSDPLYKEKIREREYLPLTHSHVFLSGMIALFVVVFHIVHVATVV